MSIPDRAEDDMTSDTVVHPKMGVMVSSLTFRQLLFPIIYECQTCRLVSPGFFHE